MFDFSVDSNVTTENIRAFLETVVSSAEVDAATHSRVAEVASLYRDKYMRNLRNKYGFGDREVAMVKDDFQRVSARLLKIIEQSGAADTKTYKKYLETYPFLFFDAVPEEVLEGRLAAHAVEENNKLRQQVTEMSASIGHLLTNLADIQKTLELPPIAKAVFEHLPDPLILASDPTYPKYRRGMDVYHSIYTQLGDGSAQLREKFLENIEAFLSEDAGSLVSTGVLAGVTGDDITVLAEMVRDVKK